MSNIEALKSGTLVGVYRIDRALRTDGYTIEYAARVEGDDREYLVTEFCPSDLLRRHRQRLKPLSDSAASLYAAGLSDFLAEAERLVALQDVRMTQVIDAFAEHGSAYQICSRPPGQTLAQLLHGGSSSLPDWLDLRCVLMSALSSINALARHGLVHGDIHPGTLWVRENGLVMVQDFAMVRLRMAQRLGRSVPVRPGYASLARYLGPTQVDMASDVYALGASLYWAALGQVPLDALRRAQLLEAGQPDPLTPLADSDRWPPSMAAQIGQMLRVDMEFYRQHRDQLESVARPEPLASGAPRAVKQVPTQRVPAVPIAASEGPNKHWFFYSVAIAASALALAAGGLWFAG